MPSAKSIFKRKSSSKAKKEDYNNVGMYLNEAVQWAQSQNVAVTGSTYSALVRDSLVSGSVSDFDLDDALPTYEHDVDVLGGDDR